jgi:hypothetical protein
MRPGLRLHLAYASAVQSIIVISKRDFILNLRLCATNLVMLVILVFNHGVIPKTVHELGGITSRLRKCQIQIRTTPKYMNTGSGNLVLDKISELIELRKC